MRGTATRDRPPIPTASRRASAPEVGFDREIRPRINWRVGADDPGPQTGRTPCVNIDLPDLDVFAIDSANSLSGGRSHTSTPSAPMLFNMVGQPGRTARSTSPTPRLPNEVRFEGAGIHGESTVQGHLSPRPAITVVDRGGRRGRHRATSIKHLDYSRAAHRLGSRPRGHQRAGPAQPCDAASACPSSRSDGLRRSTSPLSARARSGVFDDRRASRTRASTRTSIRHRRERSATSN